jgi:hypothetical protein
MSNAPSDRRATYADVLAAPERVVAEVVEGVLYTNARPAMRRAAAASVLQEELGPPFKRGRGGPGGWIIVLEPELHLHEDIVVPDLAGWRRERMPLLPDAAFTEMPPDWLCEVISPRTARLDRMKKLPVYRREGVRHTWLVDPQARTVEVFRLEAERYSLVGTWGEADTARLEPFDAIELDLSILWADVERAPDDA